MGSQWGWLVCTLLLSLQAFAAVPKLTKFSGVLVHQGVDFYLRTDSRRWTIDVSNLTHNRLKLLSDFTGEDVELTAFNEGGVIRLPAGSSGGFRMHHSGETLRIMPGTVSYLGKMHSVAGGLETYVTLRIDQFKAVRIRLAGHLTETKSFLSFKERFESPQYRFLIRGTQMEPRVLSVRSIVALPITDRYASEMPPEAPILACGRVYKLKERPKDNPARYGFQDELNRPYFIETTFRPPLDTRVVLSGVQVAPNRLKLVRKEDVRPMNSQCESTF